MIQLSTKYFYKFIKLNFKKFKCYKRKYFYIKIQNRVVSKKSLINNTLK